MSAYRTAALQAGKRVAFAPSEMLVRAGFYGVIVVVLTALWRVATDANSGQVAGYTFVAVAWYMVFSEGAVTGTKPRMIETIGSDIGSGSVTVEMLRPISVVSFRIATECAEGFVRFTVIGGFGTVLGWLIAGAPPKMGAFLLAIVSGFIAVACNIVAQHAFAGISFWQNEAKAAWFLYQKCVFMIGGMLLPIEVLPDWLQNIAWVLPFWTMSYAPARLAAGFWEPWLLVGQIAWLGVLYLAAVSVFGAGERRLQEMGA